MGGNHSRWNCIIHCVIMSLRAARDGGTGREVKIMHGINLISVRSVSILVIV